MRLTILMMSTDHSITHSGQTPQGACLDHLMSSLQPLTYFNSYLHFTKDNSRIPGQVKKLVQIHAAKK